MSEIPMVTITKTQLDELLIMLDKLEFAGCDGEPYGGCSAACYECGGEAPRTVHWPARRIDAYTRTEAKDVRTGGHKDDCELARLLKAYGYEPEYESQHKGPAGE